MNRNDFQILANLRIKEAQTLFDNDCYEGAYYLAGYAVECALKACIAKMTQQYDFPPSSVKKIYTHNLEDLISESGLKQERSDRENAEPDFAKNWAIVKDWSEEKRYTIMVDEKLASNLLTAITDVNYGVMTWLTKSW